MKAAGKMEAEMKRWEAKRKSREGRVEGRKKMRE